MQAYYPLFVEPAKPKTEEEMAGEQDSECPASNTQGAITSTGAPTTSSPSSCTTICSDQLIKKMVKDSFASITSTSTKFKV